MVTEIELKLLVSGDVITQIEKVLLQMPSEYSRLINSKSLVKTNNEEYNTVKDLAIKMGIFTN